MGASMTKDPNARLDYAFDWSAWLQEGETITSSSLEVALGDVTLDGDEESAGIITVWIDGGTANTHARVTCHIVTSEAREDDRSMDIRVRER